MGAGGGNAPHGHEHNSDPTTTCAKHVTVEYVPSERVTATRWAARFTPFCLAVLGKQRIEG